MTQALLPLVAAFAFLTSAAMPFHAAPATLRKPPYGLGIYDGYKTPAWILKGLARAESCERDDAIGDGGDSKGRFQLREIYHAARAAAWGEYDATWPNDSARIASCIYQYNLALLGNWYLALAAHRQGADGVKADGPSWWYVERVIRGGQ